jgi:hypothetical protein
MANDARKWLPLLLVAATIAVTGVLLRDLPSSVTIDLRGLLPFDLEKDGDAAPRWVAVMGIPLIAALVWLLFQMGRTRAGLRLARSLYPNVSGSLADPASVERFRAAYDTIALWIVILVLGVHAGTVASALGHETVAPRIITVVMGISLVAAGNVMPRVRPNLLAGVRTRRTLTDPELWRATHRLLGIAFVIAGTITALVGLLLPAYGLMTGVIVLIGACVVASIGGIRARRGLSAAAFVCVSLACGRDAMAQQPNARPTCRAPAHHSALASTRPRLVMITDGGCVGEDPRARAHPESGCDH